MVLEPIDLASAQSGAASATGAAAAPQVLLPLLPGDLAVTGFSGSKLATDGIAPGVDPVDKTIIDLDGVSLRIVDLSQAGATPAGQLLNPPVKLAVKARDIGQVFGLALDDHGGTAAPDLFAAATSVFGLQIITAEADKDGSPKRLESGAPGAKFMSGQFGGLPGAGPGTIFKIDGTTGAASVFGNTSHNGAANSGPGLTALAIDGPSRSLYAADLDTGVIQRFALDGGAASATPFDHGTQGRTAAGRSSLADDGSRLDPASPKFKPDDPSTWASTPAARRVTALAVHDQRLYYGVAEGPEVWSVAIGSDGSFGSDARFETAVASTKPGTVTSIAFDKSGHLIVALRGAQKSPFNLGQFVEDASGMVLAFEPAASGGRWSTPPKEYAIGSGTGNAGGTGGVTLGHGFDANGLIDTAQCSTTLAATGDTLLDPASDERVVHGVQVNSAELVKPANTPPAQSTFVDFDALLGNTSERGHVGAVLAVQLCGEAAEGPAVADAGGASGAGGSAPGASEPSDGAPPGAGESPVDGEQEVTEDEQVIDPNAPNMAVSKTRSCSQPSPDKLDCEFTIKARNTGATPFDFSGAAVEDNFSVPPVTPVDLKSGGVEQTASGFRLPGKPGTIVPVGNETPGLTFKSSFNVPPEGLVVENCASLTFPGGAAGGETPAADPNAPAPADPAVPPGLSVALAGEPQCTDNGDGQTQDCTFLVDFTNASQGPANAAFKLETDIKPVPGLDFGGPNGSSTDTVNGVAVVKGSSLGPGQKPNPPLMPVTGTFPKGPKPKGVVTVDGATALEGFAPADAQAASGAPQTLAEQAKAKAAVSPSIKVSSGPLKNDSKTPGCEVLPDGHKSCQWFLDVTSPVSDFTNAKFAANFSVAPKGTVRTDQFGQNPVGNSTTDGKNFAFNLNVPEGQTNVFVSGIFPGDQPDPVLNASTLDFGTAGDPDKVLAALAKADPTPSTGGGAATGSVDSNPADNTACVTFDTNNPDAPDVATNEPTQGTPVPDAAEGDPGAEVMPDDDGAADPDVAPVSDLSITKEQDCKPNGANKVACTFTFKIKNEGKEDFVFGKDAVIDDVLTGAQATGPLTSKDQPNIKATTAGFSSLSGATTVIPAGQEQSFKASGDFDVPPGGLKFENCATLKTEPAGTAVDHVPPPQDADLLDGPDVPRTPGLNGKADRGVRIEPQGPCLVRGAVKDCFFTVFMENHGDIAVPHGFKVDAGPKATSVVTDPGFNSVPPVTTNKAEFTNIQALIEPGKSRSVTVRVTVPADSGPASLTAETVNNVTAANQGEGTSTANDKAGPVQSAAVPDETVPPPLASADSNPDNNKNCKTFDSNAPPPKPKLAITKTGGAQCAKVVASGVWNCTWGIKVQNAGDTPFSGTFAFEEEMSLPSSAQIVKVTGGNAACANTAGTKRTCDGTATDLAPGAAVDINFETNTPFDALPVDTPPGNCRVSNKISTAAASPFGAQTTAPIESALEIGKNLGKKIPCDPPALKLAKTAKSCTATGSGFDCRYTLTVTSVGPDPFNGGIIEIQESIAQGASLKSESADWRCDGTGLCKLGPVTLDVGASKDLNVVMSVPKGNVKPGQCEIKNDAAIIQSGRDMSSAIGDFKASATARIDSPECSPKCYGGMVLGANGQCDCPEGQTYDTGRARCMNDSGGTTGLQNAVATPRTCTSGMRLNAAGNCDCPSGSVLSGGACRTRAALPPPPIACPTGWTGRYPDCRRVTYTMPRNEPKPRGGTNSSRDDDEPRIRGGSNTSKDPGRPATPKLSGGTNNAIDDDTPTTRKTGPSVRYKYCYGRTIPASDPCIAPQTNDKPRGGTNSGRPPDKPKQPAGCPSSRPNGTPPYCCAPGAYWKNGACRSGSAGKKPNSNTFKINPGSTLKGGPNSSKNDNANKPTFSSKKFKFGQPQPKGGSNQFQQGGTKPGSKTFKIEQPKLTGGTNSAINNPGPATPQQPGKAKLKFRTSKFPGTPADTNKRVNYGASANDVKKPDQGPR